MKLKYYSDSGHGWIAVKRQVLKDLEIADLITEYSYQKGKTVYLEEDCDALTLSKALKNQGILVEFESKYTNKTSPIRNYKHFKNEV